MENQLDRIKIDALKCPEQAKEIAIKDIISLNSANAFLVKIKRIRKEIGKAFDPIIKKAHDAHKEALSTKKRFDQPLMEAELIIKPQISSYLAILAQKQREAEEVARKAEEERKQKLEAAFKTDEAGDAEKAKNMREEAAPEITPVEYISTPKLEGTSIRKIWKWRVVDVNIIPREYLIVNPNMITAEMRKSKEATDIPGIQVYSEDSISTRV